MDKRQQPENDNEDIRSRLRSRKNTFPNYCNIAQGYAFVAKSYEPDTFEQAMKCSERKIWQKAIKEEINSLQKNETWQLVERRKNKKNIDNRWVFGVKLNKEGEIDRYSGTRLVLLFEGFLNSLDWIIRKHLA